jgi:glycosyltransferase involved in cell wall biosynthesis
MLFDCIATLHSLVSGRLPLVLGYNTAVLSLLYRAAGRRSIMNMDGTEWRRGRWPRPVKVWYRINELLGCLLSDHLIADNPEIFRHLTTRARVRACKVSTIPYGADSIEYADPALLTRYGLASRNYALGIGRIVPENSILEIVRSWGQAGLEQTLVLLGAFAPDQNTYHRAIKEAADQKVQFLGAVYDKGLVNALRFHSRFYIHGHQVGGTNPSLVEALGAGSPIIAHDNCFNRWVAGPDAMYFRNEDELIRACSELARAPAQHLAKLSAASRARHVERFRWEDILADYHRLLLEWSNR